MLRRPRSCRIASAFALAITLAACKPQDSATIEPTAEPKPDRSATEPLDSSGIAGDPVSKELPPELVADLRLTGSGTDGRLLTIAPGFVASVESSDSGAPTYLRFLAVRCADSHHCEVLTEPCEGSISRDVDTFVVEFAPIDVATAEICAGYSGTFELP